MTVELLKGVLGLSVVAGLWLMVDLAWQRARGSEAPPRKLGCGGCRGCAGRCSEAGQEERRWN